MFTLYLTNYQSAPKTITDRPSVHTWSKWSGTTFETIMTRKAPIPKKIRSVWDSFLECLFTLDPNDLARFFRWLWPGKLRFRKRYVPYRIAFWNAQFPCEQPVQRIGPFLKRNRVIILSDLRQGSHCQTKTNMEHTRSGTVWTVPLRIDQVWFDYPEQCAHCTGPISKLAQKSFRVNIAWIVQYVVVWSYDYTVRCIVPILLYWCHVIGYNFTMPRIQEVLTCISWYVIRVKDPWTEHHLNLWQNEA